MIDNDPRNSVRSILRYNRVRVPQIDFVWRYSLFLSHTRWKRANFHYKPWRNWSILSNQIFLSGSDSKLTEQPSIWSVSTRCNDIDENQTTLAWWLECSPMAWETLVQSQVESHQKLKKIMLDASLLNTQHYKSRIMGKMEQSRERNSASSTPWCSSYRKGSLRVTLDYGRQIYYLLRLEGMQRRETYKEEKITVTRRD